MNKTTLHNTKRILAMMLSLALLVSTFCCTGITLPVSAASTTDYAKITFTTVGPTVVDGMGNILAEKEKFTDFFTVRLGSDNANDATLEAITRNTKTISIDGTDVVLLAFPGGNDRINLKNTSFTSDKNYTVNVEYVIGDGKVYGDKPYLEFGTDKVQNDKWAFDTTQQVGYKKFTYSYPENDSDSAISYGSLASWKILYQNSGTDDCAKVHIISIEIVATDYVPPTPGTGYASVAFNKDSFISTGMEHPIWENADSNATYNHVEATNGGRIIKDCTFPCTDISGLNSSGYEYALRMQNPNDRFVMRFAAEAFKRGSADEGAKTPVTATARIYFPSEVSYADNVTVGWKENGTSLTTLETIKAVDNKGQIATFTHTFADIAEVNGKDIWLHYETGGATYPVYILDIEFKAYGDTTTDSTFHSCTLTEGANGTASIAQAGNNVVAVATPDRGYKFTGWTVDSSAEVTNVNSSTSDATYYFTMGDNVTITPSFIAAVAYDVNVSVTPENSGTAMWQNNTATAADDTSNTNYEGDSITFTATPKEGYVFTGWYNGEELVSSAASYTFPLTSDTTLTAKFARGAVEPMMIVGGTAATKSNSTGYWTLSANGSIKITNLTEQDAEDYQPLLNTTTKKYVLDLTYTATAAGTITAKLMSGEGDALATINHNITNGENQLLSLTLDASNSKLTSLDKCYIEITSISGVTITGAKLYNEGTNYRYLEFVPTPKTISLDIQILDYVPNGLLFQMDTTGGNLSNIVFNLDPNGVRAWYQTKEQAEEHLASNDLAFEYENLGAYCYLSKSNPDFSKITTNGTLVEDQLVDGHPVYKAFVVQYLVENALMKSNFYNTTMSQWQEGATGTTVELSGKEDNGGTEWNALITLIKGINEAYLKDGATEAEKAAALGSWATTLAKVDGKTNGGKLAYNKITTLYDAAYYMLNTLFVSDSNYNKEVTEYETLTMQAASEDGYYEFDSDKALNYDVENGTISKKDDSTGNQFFPINNLGYADRVTASNDGSPNQNANYAFTMQGHGEFTYHEETDTTDHTDAQYFEFTGDDDVYLFINGYNIFSLDGLHSRKNGKATLTSQLAAAIGLEDGKTYSFDFFFMERHTTDSNLKIYTNIAVQKPTLTVQKNAYADEEYTQSFHATDDTVSPFTTAYYEFVLENKAEENSGAAPFVNIAFEDPKLGTTISAESGFSLNDFTKVQDLVFIVIDDDLNETKYYWDNDAYYTATKANGATAWTNGGSIAAKDEEFETFICTNALYKVTENADGNYTDGGDQPISDVWSYGLPLNYTLKVQGVRTVLTETLPNSVTTHVQYFDGTTYPDAVYGNANQTINVSSWDKVYTVDYSNPLVVDPFDGTVTVESTNTTNDITAVSEKDVIRTEPNPVQEGNDTLVKNADDKYTYTLNGEMTQTQVYEVTESLPVDSAFQSIMLGTDNSSVVSSMGQDTDAAGKVSITGTDAIAHICNMNVKGAYATFKVSVDSDCTAAVKVVYMSALAGTIGLGYGKIESDITGAIVTTTYSAGESWSASPTGVVIPYVLTLTEGDNYIRFYGNGIDINICGIELLPVATYTKTITFVPASNVYYDDAFVVDKMLTTDTDADGWTRVDENGGEVEVSANNSIGERDEAVYGHGGNAAFKDNSAFFNNSALKTDGNEILSFRFTGNGVDVFTRTDKFTGEIRVTLWKINDDGTKTLTKLRYIDCEYASGVLYQIPVISFYDLTWGTYQVDIYVYPKGNGFSGERSNFYFDGIRVYNPLEETNPTDPNAADKYAEEDEWDATYISLRDVLLNSNAIEEITAGSVESANGNGALYYDYITKESDKGEDDTGTVDFTYTAEEYEKYGPKHEVYLAAGQAISFTLTEGYKGAQIAAKAADGQTSNMTVYYYNGTEMVSTPITINSTAEMFYTLPESKNGMYIIKNGSTVGENEDNPILSLSKLKLTYERVEAMILTDVESGEAPASNGALVVTADTVAYATAVLNGDTETAAALAEKLSTNKVEEYGIGSVTPVLNGAAAPIVTVEAVDATEIAVEEALEARDALIKTLVARICTAA